MQHKDRTRRSRVPILSRSLAAALVSLVPYLDASTTRRLHRARTTGDDATALECLQVAYGFYVLSCYDKAKKPERCAPLAARLGRALERVGKSPWNSRGYTPNYVTERANELSRCLGGQRDRLGICLRKELKAYVESEGKYSYECARLLGMPESTYSSKKGMTADEILYRLDAEKGSASDKQIVETWDIFECDCNPDDYCGCSYIDTVYHDIHGIFGKPGGSYNTKSALKAIGVKFSDG